MKLLKTFAVVLGLGLFVLAIVMMNGGAGTAVSADTAVTPDGAPSVTTSLVAGGFANPVDIANAGDDRLFIVERAGVIKIINGDGTVRGTPFLSITNVVNDSFSERGLLGLAFHPGYPTTPYFYVNYTTAAIDGHSVGDTVIARFEVNPATPHVATAGSRTEIMNIDQPDWNHNGGDLNFGPDNYLYIGTGDGGSSNDPSNYAQTNSVLLGKMLRIDVDGGGNAPECDADGNYTIPADNPFVDGSGGACDEIWSTGLRNPWRFSFDSATGDMWIGDVGQWAWEEIDHQPAAGGGENWGWRCYEGDEENILSGCLAPSNYDFPEFVYGHSASGGFAVTGGYVYRGSDYPDLQGYYLTADYGTNNAWLLSPDGGGGFNSDPIGQLPLPGASNPSPSSFGEGCDNELYVAHYASGTSGAIYQVQTSSALLAGGDDVGLFLPIINKAEGTPVDSTPTATSTATHTPEATATNTATVTPPTATPTPTITPTPQPLVCSKGQPGAG